MPSSAPRPRFPGRSALPAFLCWGPRIVLDFLKERALSPGPATVFDFSNLVKTSSDCEKLFSSSFAGGGRAGESPNKVKVLPEEVCP